MKDETSLTHAVPCAAERPERFTYPFCYEPHPLAVAAAGEVRRHVLESRVMDAEEGGKMFGVLVVDDGTGSLRFLAAYSGLLAGRNDWPYFVPPVFDAQQPDGHFKTCEGQISRINAEIAALEDCQERREAVSKLRSAETEAALRIDDFRRTMKQAKLERDRRRAEGGLTPDEEAALTRESQYMKAQLRRIRKSASAALEAARSASDSFDRRIEELRSRRKTMSDELQHWLFSQYRMLDARGEERDLLSIFAPTPSGTPPAGAGDCCAPKLLQYAYAHGMKPVCMAEFWIGRAPKNELRIDGHYYPACSGKCKPILGHMLRGLDVDPDPLLKDNSERLRVVFEDDAMAVVDKPPGMLSVPGLSERESVIGIMRSRWGQDSTPLTVHRLDMDTSGLMLIARNEAARLSLQRQFLARRIHKEYVALLSAVPDRPAKGVIRLALRPDMLDRPRQKVDAEGGKEAVTVYEITGREGRFARVRLWPQTGRTHQLRVHCAHPDGLGCPILGDPLYGTRGPRMMLHAAAITFVHPVTGRTMTFRSSPDF